MNCHRCNGEIEQGEEMEYRGETLCEDCYMDALSPAKACDPWAVYSAKCLERHMGAPSPLTAIQAEILRVLEETEGIEKIALLERFNGRLTLPELEREFASLRHMEKARAEKRAGKIFLRTW